MKKAYEAGQQGRNRSILGKITSANKSTASLISLSMSRASSKMDDVKNKLAYEWKNIFRGLSQVDLEKKGVVNINLFNKIIH
jgi:hypothetical protein